MELPAELQSLLIGRTFPTPGLPLGAGGFLLLAACLGLASAVT